jgi:ERCC4-related helicase
MDNLIASPTQMAYKLRDLENQVAELQEELKKLKESRNQMAKKPRKISDDELSAQLDSEIQGATGYANTELSNQREEAMQYYLGEPFGNEIDGRSEIVTTDVRDTVEYIMPSLMRIFTTHNNIAEFEPQGPEDEEIAQQATDYCNYVFNRQNNGFKVLYDAFKDYKQDWNH